MRRDDGKEELGTYRCRSRRRRRRERAGAEIEGLVIVGDGDGAGDGAGGAEAEREARGSEAVAGDEGVVVVGIAPLHEAAAAPVGGALQHSTAREDEAREKQEMGNQRSERKKHPREGSTRR